MNNLKGISIEKLLDKLVDLGETIGNEVDRFPDEVYKEVIEIKKEIMRRFYAGEPMK